MSDVGVSKNRKADVKTDWRENFREKYLGGTDEYDYNDWFQFFQKQPATFLINYTQDFQDNLPADGYAAFCRWLDIFENPIQMEKIAKSRMENEQSDDKLELAISDDDEKFYEAEVRDLVAQRSDKNNSPQEYSRLSALIMKARDNLKEIRSRKPKEGSTLANVLSAAAKNREKIAKKKIVAKKKSTPVKTTSRKAAGAPKKKKTTSTTSKNSRKKAKAEKK